MTYTGADISYCSNVHAGETLADISRIMRDFIQPVSSLRPLTHRADQTMATGLWISAAAASQLSTKQDLQDFSRLLNRAGLRLTSLNGFPYGGFHRTRVKDQVYLPDWSESKRLDYSKKLADILVNCLPQGSSSGAISTLPLGYKSHWNSEKQAAANQQLAELTRYLAQLKQETGKHILFCLEMEPDCVLESTAQLLSYFSEVVQPQLPFPEHLGVCYDVCHQAVMFEDAYDSLQKIVDAGIPLGKIQLSSALQAEFITQGQDQQKIKENETLRKLLQQFAEPTYLHQVKSSNDRGQLEHWHDLALALDTFSTPDKTDKQIHPKENNDSPAQKAWRIHFHVPVDSKSLIHPQLTTTQADICRVFDFLADNRHLSPCLEIETYSWQVLPQALRPANDQQLIAGIVNELNWVEEQLRQRQLLL